MFSRVGGQARQALLEAGECIRHRQARQGADAASRAAMEALGVGDDTRVVLYDAMGLGWATRVWWMLRWIGFDRAAVLDGGLAAWTAAGGELSTEQVERPTGTITPVLRPELIADRVQVLAAAAFTRCVVAVPSGRRGRSSRSHGAPPV